MGGCIDVAPADTARHSWGMNTNTQPHTTALALHPIAAVAERFARWALHLRAILHRLAGGRQRLDAVDLPHGQCEAASGGKLDHRLGTIRRQTLPIDLVVTNVRLGAADAAPKLCLGHVQAFADSSELVHDEIVALLFHIVNSQASFSE